MLKTKSSKFTHLLLALCLILMPVMLSGCEEKEPESSEPVSVSQPDPTATPEPEPEATASPQPTPTPEASAVEDDASDGGFHDLFYGNAIDQALNDDLDMVATNNAIILAYESAIKRWQTFIDMTYESCLPLLDADAQEDLRQGQVDWQDELTESLKDSTVDQDEATATRLLMERYRDRAYDLAYIYYNAAGKMPDFERAVSGEAMG